MIITFNLNELLSFWLGTGEIGIYQYDIRLIIAHEIIHGVGFTDSTMNWEIEAKEEEAPFLVKIPFLDSNYNCFGRTNVFTHFLAGLTYDYEYIYDILS